MRLLVTVYLLWALGAWVQDAVPEPAFDVASIKLNSTANGNNWETTPGLLRAQMTLKRCIAFAYNVGEFQVVGGPSWSGLDHYDITAKLERIDSQRPDDLQIREAMRMLLAERFHLTFHHELKQMSGYALIPAKRGLMLTPVSDEGHPNTGVRGGLKRQLTATQANMARLAAFLAQEIGSPVEDQTHIPGVYTFTLEWVRDDLESPRSEESALPRLFTALQEKLGLRLEVRRFPVELFVIDRAERPSD